MRFGKIANYALTLLMLGTFVVNANNAMCASSTTTDKSEVQGVQLLKSLDSCHSREAVPGSAHSDCACLCHGVNAVFVSTLSMMLETKENPIFTQATILDSVHLSPATPPPNFA